ncbi:GNAT family N-acetyltransferase [Streptomyces sp. NBC_00400]|uniref:GNAT family N-acetyltransferase n=1 Tax=Streptomyces sp. NBC_00400 TaxID=2975737 RepID=UPI002E1BD39B
MVGLRTLQKGTAMTRTASRVQEVCALPADGSTVRLRPARPEDRGQVLRLYEEMSVDNLRSRFFAVSRRSGEQAADRLCALAAPGHRTLVAVHGDRLVGVAEYETVDDPTSAGIALAVADDFHHRGVGTLLLEHLVHTARENGVAVFTADVLADNHLIHTVFATIYLSLPRPHAIPSSPGRTESPQSTPGSACCHVAHTTPACAGFREGTDTS